jgi:hypothetical protein
VLWTRAVVAGASLGGVVLTCLCLTASAASAEVDGDCTGAATFPELGGTTYTAEDTGVLVVPVEDTVTYEGTVGVPEGTERTHSGQIALDLPWPLPDPTLADWGTETDESSDTDTYHYEVPSFAPRGVELRLYGEHNDEIDCSGEVTVEIEGGVLDAPLAVAVAIAGTLASGAGLAAAVRGRRP